MKNTYYVRIHNKEIPKLEEHLTLGGTKYEMLSSDFADGNATVLYSISMTTEEVLAMKLAVPLVGCMNLTSVCG